jgi:hypothetical protein
MSSVERGKLEFRQPSLQQLVPFRRSGLNLERLDVGVDRHASMGVMSVVPKARLCGRGR